MQIANKMITLKLIPMGVYYSKKKNKEMRTWQYGIQLVEYMKKTSLFVVFATSSFLFGDISKYVTSADINSIAFENSENYAKLVSMPITEKQKIISLIQELDQLGLEKIFIQNMAKIILLALKDLNKQIC